MKKALKCIIGLVIIVIIAVAIMSIAQPEYTLCTQNTQISADGNKLLLDGKQIGTIEFIKNTTVEELENKYFKGYLPLKSNIDGDNGGIYAQYLCENYTVYIIPYDGAFLVLNVTPMNEAANSECRIVAQQTVAGSVGWTDLNNNQSQLY